MSDRPTTVVFLHALGASRRMWRAQLEALGGRYELVAPDLPGHGHSPEPFTFDAAVATVRRVLDDVTGDAYLVGASLGGAVALHVALAEPARVSGLLLSGTPVRMSAAGLWVQRAVTATLPLATSATMSARIVRIADSRDSDAFVDDIVRAGKRTQARALRALARDDLTARLPDIEARTLVCCGEQDRANLASARLLADGIPRATLRLVPDAGHLWNLQRPDLCTRIVDEFVGGN